MSEKEQLTKFLTEEKMKEFDETKKQLDVLRSTRRSRGGVGAPLQVPGHLQDAAEGRGIIVTDADLNAPVDPALFRRRG